MNIAMFTNTYCPHVGGVAQSISTSADRFRDAGHHVLIIAPEFDGQHEEADVIRVAAIRDFNDTGFSLALPPPPAVTRAVREFEPDIIHSHHPFLLGDTALRVRAQLNVPIVLTYHTMYERYTHYLPIEFEQLGPMVVSLATDYANSCDHIVAPTASVRELLRGRGVETPMSVVPTGVDERRFAAGSRKRGRALLGIPEDAFVVGHVGRLAVEKNLELITKEVGDALETNRSGVFLVVGEGPERHSMEQTLRARIGSSRIRFAGSRSGQELVDAYHAMDVFAFASTSDTQGMVLAEAMACGVPVVAVDAPGARDIVRAGINGILVPADDPAGHFAKAICEFFECDEAGRAGFGRAARATALDWSIDRCCERYLAVYDRTRREFQGVAMNPGRVRGFMRGAADFLRLWGRRIKAGVRILVKSRHPSEPIHG